MSIARPRRYRGNFNTKDFTSSYHPKQRAPHSVRSEMFIAVNANKPTFSVRRSGRAGCDLSVKSVSAPPNGEGDVLLFQNYKHLAPNGAKTRVYLPPPPYDPPFHVRAAVPCQSSSPTAKWLRRKAVCRRKSSAQPRLWARPGASAGRSITPSAES